MSRVEVIRVRPLHYMHVKDTNTGIVSVICGATKFTCLENQDVILPPTKMILVPPRHYVVIDNPAVRKQVKLADGRIEEVADTEPNGQVVLRHGDQEIRFSQQPFPLHDGEIAGKVMPLQIVAENTALLLEATRPLKDSFGQSRTYGEKWYFKGPATYFPQVGVKNVKLVSAIILHPDEALKVTSSYDCVDYQGNRRRAGEEWLVTGLGAYLPGITETVSCVQDSITLNWKTALKLKAKTNFKDFKGQERRAAEEWLLTRNDCPVYIPNVTEQVLGEQPLTVLKDNQYCLITNPYSDEKKTNIFGKKKLIKGPNEFFLQPGEQGTTYNSYLLGPRDALQLTATADTKEIVNNKEINRKAGEYWLVHGPQEYWPGGDVAVVNRHQCLFGIDYFNFYVFETENTLWTIFLFVIALFVLWRKL